MRAGVAVAAVALAWMLPGIAHADTVEIVAGSGPFAFEPARITVRVGDTVTWTMGPGDPHTVTSGTYNASGVHPDGRFDSGQLRPGETFSMTFTEPGEIPYVCAIHADSGMTGRIIVEAVGDATPTASRADPAPSDAGPSDAGPTDAGPSEAPSPDDPTPGVEDPIVLQVLVAAMTVGAVAILVAVRIRLGRRDA